MSPSAASATRRESKDGSLRDIVAFPIMRVTTRSQENRMEKEKPPPKAPDQPAAETPRGEIGGPKGPEPTRYQDWEKAGRCIDF
jgi:hypothetical protein